MAYYETEQAIVSSICPPLMGDKGRPSRKIGIFEVLVKNELSSSF
jgi:hypothetical protein